MANEPKRAAQNALFAAIQSQAENNMKSALRATEKATLLRELAEAYRLTAGGALPEVTTGRRRGEASGGAESEGGRPSGRRAQAQEDSDQEESRGDEDQSEEERPKRRPVRRRQSGR